MDRIETLQLRPYGPADKGKAVSAFSQLILASPIRGLKAIVLLQDATLDSDLCIVLHWRQATMIARKSPLGIRLAGVFYEFGRIDHIVWSDTGIIHRSHRRLMDPRAPSSINRQGEDRNDNADIREFPGHCS
jgi:hypothetical protein